MRWDIFKGVPFVEICVDAPTNTQIAPPDNFNYFTILKQGSQETKRETMKCTNKGCQSMMQDHKRKVDCDKTHGIHNNCDCAWHNAFGGRTVIDFRVCKAIK